MIFNLPVAPYPTPDWYEHLRPFLFAKNLQLSHGALKGRSEEVWQYEIEELSAPDMVRQLEEHQFGGLLINRKSFPDRAAGLVSELEALGRLQILEDLSDDFIFVLLNTSGDIGSLPSQGSFQTLIGSFKPSIWRNHLDNFHSSVWTNGNGIIKDLHWNIENSQRYLVIDTYGYNPYIKDLEKLRLLIRINGIIAPFRFQSETYKSFYFWIPEQIKVVQQVAIESTTFTPVDLGINEDTSSLGIDVKAVRVERVQFRPRYQPDKVQGFYNEVWINGYAVIEKIRWRLGSSDRYLVVDTYGYNPYRYDLDKLDLRVRVNTKRSSFKF